MKNSNTGRLGFTLIELLVVVLIIGILAAIALPQYKWAVEKSRASEAMILTRAIADAHTVYFLANGTYADYPDLGLDIPGEEETLSDTVHGVRTKYFRCRTRTADGATQYLALCNRYIGNDNSYSIYVNTDGTWHCSFVGAITRKLCQKLTGKTVSPGNTSLTF